MFIDCDDSGKCVVVFGCCILLLVGEIVYGLKCLFVYGVYFVYYC